MIKKIKWNNYKALGDLELDFSKPDGSVYNTIILAGENGVGKTTILETLAQFLNLGSIEPFEYINYQIDNDSYTIFPDPKNLDGAQYGFHSRRNDSTGVNISINTNKYTNPTFIEEDTTDIRHYGVAYSKARSGFNTQKVTSSTLQQLDIDKYENDEKDDFTSLKQLLVDVDAQDNSEWMRITKSGKGTSFDEFKKTSKIHRFEEAFNDFFENIKFKNVDDTDPNEKRIIFEKHEKNISIDDLSTGEKQIVFRGAHLLKNINSISNGTVLIDEPELSMHPKWQQNILQYYRKLFTKNNTQSVQMIIATHSEYILRAALEDRDNVLIITLSDDNGTIVPKRITAPSVLPTITAAETNYLAFGIISPDYHIELYGYLQNKTNRYSVKNCDDYIVAQTSIYNPTLHYKPSSFTNNIRGNTVTYQTLPTYIRNAIDHPSPTNTYTQDELKTSIELLIQLCR